MSAQLPRPSASAGAASGCAVIHGKIVIATQWQRDAGEGLESARANASMPPDEAEMEGAWVRRWDAAAGGAAGRLGDLPVPAGVRRRHRRRRS